MRIAQLTDQRIHSNCLCIVRHASCCIPSTLSSQSSPEEDFLLLVLQMTGNVFGWHLYLILVKSFMTLVSSVSLYKCIESSTEFRAFSSHLVCGALKPIWSWSLSEGWSEAWTGCQSITQLTHPDRQPVVRRPNATENVQNNFTLNKTRTFCSSVLVWSSRC